MADNTSRLQLIAARAIDRAVGSSFMFYPAGDEAEGFRVDGTFNPNPTMRMPDGSQIQTGVPTAFVSAPNFASLVDGNGAKRNPQGGNVSPDYIRLNPSEERRQVLSAELGQNGFWKLELTNPA